MISQSPQRLSQLTWNNRFAQLGETFSSRLSGTELPNPQWLSHSRLLAQEMGLTPDWMQEKGVLEALSGNAILEGSEPLASVYSGHQFGVWAGQLGDGRALYLGEVATPLGPMEIQLKGAGPTPYSRRADGRAVLRSTVREFLCSEAMAGLGIATTRALCMVSSPLPVYREERETAAVVTRVAPSFIRFGHFEHFAALQNTDALLTLTEFVLELSREDLQHHLGLPDLADLSLEERCLAFLELTAIKYAKLMSQWQGVGFCHGVMNTDNMSILGLTMDYGPFQFMDSFDPQHICNHSDHQGRYRYGQQPQIAYWNLFCLGQAFAGLIKDTDAIVKALSTYKTHLPMEMQRVYANKLGLLQEQPDLEGVRLEDAMLKGVLQVMAEQRVDYSIFWRKLSTAVLNAQTLGQNAFNPVKELFLEPQMFTAWLDTYWDRLKSEDLALSAQCMLAHNPKFVIRNHLCETAIQAAKVGDPSEIDRLMDLLSSPFEEHPGFEAYADHPPHWAQSIAVSCSS